MNYYRDFGDLSNNSVVTDIYNKKIKGKERKYDPNSWKKLKHKKKKINKKLVAENEILHEKQRRLKK